MSMKQIIVIFSFLAACITMFWGIRSSHVPQFMLDTRHPWIEKYKNQLQRIDIDNLCQVDQGQHAKFGGGNIPSPPDDIFTRLEINNNRAGIDRDGWENALDRLLEMQYCPAALNAVEELQVDIYAWQNLMAPEGLPDLFVDILESMPSLKKLEWEVRDGANQDFGEGFRRRNLTLPSVQHLMVGPLSEYFLPMCPALEVIEPMGSSWHSGYEGRDPYDQIIQKAANSTNLKSLSIGSKSGWNEDVIERKYHFQHMKPTLLTSFLGILTSIPNLTSLTLQGSLHSKTNHWGTYGEDTGILKDISIVLRKFKSLEHLGLPGAGSLGMGFDGGAGCGNAYFGREGRAYGREVSKQSAKTIDKATEIVLTELPGLKTLSFNGERANVVRTEDGRVIIEWPWTGRLQEWAEEVWPIEPRPYDDDWQSGKNEL